MTDTTATVRSRTQLADGREIFYFDAGSTNRQLLPDQRNLPARSSSAQLRYDALRAEWVSVAAARQSRPMLPTTVDCPLCPSSETNHTEIPAHSYEVAVFENRYPSFGGVSDDRTVADPISPQRPAIGRCEVVCYTAEHGASFADLSTQRVRIVMDALADRTAQLSQLPDVEQVFCFENRGEEIGVTLHHPHGQIYGYPYITPTTTQTLAVAKSHRERNGGNLFAALFNNEREQRDRVVESNEDWTAYVPVAARWPFEVVVAPHVQVPDLAELPTRYRQSFGALYLSVLRGFDALFDMPMPYMSGWHQAPIHSDHDLSYLHLRLFSVRRAANKLKYLAGSESQMGAFVNDVPPEEAALLLRDAIAARGDHNVAPGQEKL